MPSLHYLRKLFFVFCFKQTKQNQNPARGLKDREKTLQAYKSAQKSVLTTLIFSLGFYESTEYFLPLRLIWVPFSIICNPSPSDYGVNEVPRIWDCKSQKMGQKLFCISVPNSKIYSYLREDKRERGQRKAGEWSQHTGWFCRSSERALRAVVQRLPWWSSDQDSTLPKQSAWVQSCGQGTGPHAGS